MNHTWALMAGYAACVAALVVALVLILRRRRTVHVVVARYTESLDWLESDPRFAALLSTTTVYNKGPDDVPPRLLARGVRVHPLPNVGMDVHSHVHHILHDGGDGGDNDFVLFVSASWPLIPRKRQLVDAAFAALAHNRGSAFPVANIRDAFSAFTITHYRPTASANNEVPQLTPAAVRPFGPWLDALLAWWSTCGDVKPPNAAAAPLVWCNICVTSWRALRRVPRCVLEDLYAQLSAGQNTEVAHYVERVWAMLVADADSF